MPGPRKGVPTQHTTQQQFAKRKHQPSDTDQQARNRLRNKIFESKAKIKSCAHLQLGEKTLQTVHQTFEPNIPVIFHLPALTNTTADTDTIPTLFVIQEGIHCMPTTDYFFTNIQPEPIIVSPHRGNHSEPTAQQAATKDQVSQQTHPLRPGETRVYPSMLADKQVPVLNLPKQTFRQCSSPYICALRKMMSQHMAEKNPKKMQSDYLSDSESLEEETSHHLCTSPEERLYNTIKGSAQATRAALAHTMAQCNLTVERGLAKQPKIKKLPKGQASDKLIQMKEKDKPL